jgi:hypothetical protein
MLFIIVFLLLFSLKMRATWVGGITIVIHVIRIVH